MAGGALLLTGGTVAGWVRATSESLSATTRRVKKSTSEFAAVATGRPKPAPEPETVEETEPLPAESRPPDVEPVVRATHVEAAAPSWEEDEPDAEAEPEPGRSPRSTSRSGSRSPKRISPRRGGCAAP